MHRLGVGIAADRVRVVFGEVAHSRMNEIETLHVVLLRDNIVNLSIAHISY